MLSLQPSIFVWRGNANEGSPRPPKEALVAGSIVVGLESEDVLALFKELGRPPGLHRSN